MTGTIKVNDYGNYWRLEVTTTDNGSNTSIALSYESTMSTNGTTLNPCAGSVRTLWGFQLEIGASYATSYIPTTTASVTRNQDVCSNTGISSLIGQQEGTMFVQVTAKYKNADIAYINTGVTNAVFIYKTNNNYYRAAIYAGGVAVVIEQASVI